jgi:hypothetical protein
MGSFFSAIDRTVFNLTYNEQANQAYNQQAEQAAQAVEDVKRQVNGYRTKRDQMIAAKEASDYFSQNTITRLSEWDTWVQNNGSLPAADYTAKSTEIKSQWEALLGVNTTVLELTRAPFFLDLYVQARYTELTTAVKNDIATLKRSIEDFLRGINTKTPLEITTKLEEFSQSYTEIQKKLPEFQNADTANTADLLILTTMIQLEQFNTYKANVENQQAENENEFSFQRLFYETNEYFLKGINWIYPSILGLIFGMIVSNDMIGRSPAMRVYYFLMTIAIFLFAPFGFSWLIPAYYFIRAVKGFMESDQTARYMELPVLFAVLPVKEATPGEPILFLKRLYKYDPNMYNGLAKKKQIAYEKSAAELVGKTVDGSMFGLDAKSFDDLICELKSVLLDVPQNKFMDVITALKKIV